MLLLYLIVLTFLVLVAIGGYDATMRLVAYTDLQVRYAIIRLKSKILMIRMHRRLMKDREQLLKEFAGHDQ